MSVSTGGGASRTRFDVPVGMVLHCAHANDPGLSVGDYLECNGQNVSRAVYASLFAAIGTVHGIGDGATTFGLPDSRRRSLVGKGGVATGTLGNAVGNTGGEETHTPTTAETAVHSHANSLSNNQCFGFTGTNLLRPGVGDTDGTVGSTFGINNANAGSGTAFNQYSPSLVCGVWIKT